MDNNDLLSKAKAIQVNSIDTYMDANNLLGKIMGAKYSPAFREAYGILAQKIRSFDKDREKFFDDRLMEARRIPYRTPEQMRAFKKW